MLFFSVICLQWKFVTILSFFFFQRSIKYGSMKTCFILWTDVSGVITFSNERNRKKKKKKNSSYSNLIQTTDSFIHFLF